METVTYVRNQLNLSASRLESLIYDDSGIKLPQRHVYKTLQSYIEDFTGGRSEPRWIALAGLRGVGKTTLLAQLYTNLGQENINKLYLSLDQIFDLGFSLTEVLSAYEELLGTSFEKLREPVYLFLDEVQYLEKWAITIKTIYDRSRKVFILSTGSSALSLQTNADTARRMVLEKIYPLSFAEYIHVKLQKEAPVDLAKRLKSGLFFSKNANEAFKMVQNETAKVSSFWSGIERFEIDKYLRFGTLPASLNLTNETLIFQRIHQIMDAVIQKDITKLNSFDKETIGRLPQLLYAISAADMVSVVKLANTLRLDPKTVTQALSALEKTEVLLRILPHGAHYSQVRKPSKYLFTSSAYRAMYYNLAGSIEYFENYKGKLLEDVVGMYLARLFTKTVNTSLTYDSAESGADFILNMGPAETVILEVSLGKKNLKQAQNTMRKIKGKYGLIISRTNLSLHEEENCLSIPLEYFLLI